VIFSSYEFKFIILPEGFATGSSLMPQKKNPDVAELIRGKSGRVFGHLLALLATLKGLPLAYNRDLQEDKFPLFDTVDTLNASVSIFTAMLKEIEFDKDVLERQSEKGAILATDLVYYLVKKGTPFRKAHEIVGKVVAYCEDTKIDLAYLSHKELKKFSPKFGYEVSKVLNSKESVNAKATKGGTSPKRVKEAIESARKNLLHD
jgi:argininosuccinate lyase